MLAILTQKQDAIIKVIRPYIVVRPTLMASGVYRVKSTLKALNKLKTFYFLPRAINLSAFSI